jgi:hypothetical protein
MASHSLIGVADDSEIGIRTEFLRLRQTVVDKFSPTAHHHIVRFDGPITALPEYHKPIRTEIVGLVNANWHQIFRPNCSEWQGARYKITTEIGNNGLRFRFWCAGNQLAEKEVDIPLKPI